MRLPLLLLCLALPASVGGQPPPPNRPGSDPRLMFAVRERQKATIGFEAVLEVAVVCRDEKRTGTARLAVEGDRFWYAVDVPGYDPARNEFTRRREERAFDGKRVYSMTPGPDADTGPGVGAAEFHVYDLPPPDGWGDPFQPLEWAYRGTHTILSPVDAADPATAAPPEIIATGRVDEIGGRRCVEMTRTVRRGIGQIDREAFWLDPERGYMPRKVRGVLIEAEHHPATGGGTTTVTVDSFELRRGMPAGRFTLAFPTGTRVTRHTASGPQAVVVAADGSLVPEGEAGRSTLPSVGRTLAVVGVVVAVFVGLVVLLKRLGRGPKPEGERPNG